jgi:hypothetical protein
MAENGFGLSDSDMVSIEIATEPVMRFSTKSKLLDHTAEIEVHAADRLTIDLSREHRAALNVTRAQNRDPTRLANLQSCRL